MSVYNNNNYNYLCFIPNREQVFRYVKKLRLFDKKIEKSSPIVKKRELEK